MKKQLGELAAVLNAFKSEAVQLRLLDLLLGQETAEEPAKMQRRTKSAKRAGPKPGPAAASEGSPGKRKKKAVSGTGAPATLTQLIGTTFFDKPKTTMTLSSTASTTSHAPSTRTNFPENWVAWCGTGN